MMEYIASLTFEVGSLTVTVEAESFGQARRKATAKLKKQGPLPSGGRKLIITATDERCTTREFPWIEGLV